MRGIVDSEEVCGAIPELVASGSPEQTLGQGVEIRVADCVLLCLFAICGGPVRVFDSACFVRREMRWVDAPVVAAQVSNVGAEGQLSQSMVKQIGESVDAPDAALKGHTAIPASLDNAGPAHAAPLLFIFLK